MTRCTRCNAKWHGLRLEHCTVCHRTFSGTKAGDAHRIGEHWPAGLRRCLTDEEMAAGGMWRDERGVWHGYMRKDGTPQRNTLYA